MCSSDYIEGRYLSLVAQYPILRSVNNVDFIGVSYKQGIFNLKFYCTQNVSFFDDYHIKDFFINLNMIKYYERVLPNNRVEFALKNRNNDNMEALFSYLKRNFDSFKKNEDLILQLSSMKVTSRHDYDYASLYFVGFDKQNLNSLKLYFYTKFCLTPDDLSHVDNCYDNSYYLGCLKNLKIDSLDNLIKYVEEVLSRDSGANLWMVGLDVQDDFVKYKLYVKDLVIYDEIFKVFLHKHFNLDLTCITRWWSLHNELACAGVTFGVDSLGEFSVSFYFTRDFV